MKNKILCLYTLSFILFLSALYGMFFTSKAKNVITEAIVLLNPNKTQLVDTLLLNNFVDKTMIEIRKVHNNYIGYYNGFVFPVVESRFEELLSLASNRVYAERITQESSLREGHRFSLSFSNSIDGKEYSTLFFGDVDFSGAKIAVCSLKGDKAYLVPNVYSFLQTNPSQWLDPKLFPKALLNGNVESNCKSILYRNEYSEKELLPGDSHFETAIELLFQLQSSNMVAFDDTITYETKENIDVHFYDSTCATITVYKKDAFEYLIVPESSTFFYALEVSAWTYEKLMSIF